MEGKKGIELEQYLKKLIQGSSTELHQKWVISNSQLRKCTENLFPEACQNHRVFVERSGKRPKNIVTICSIEGSEYNHLHDANNTAVYAGGPGSMVGAALDSVLSAKNQARPSTVKFMTHDFEHSNARSSAYYFHVRHSNALDADSWVRGHRIFLEFLHRQFLSKNGLLKESQKLGYLKVDISLNEIMSSPSQFFKTLLILSGGLWHTFRNVTIEKVSPKSTDWARNRAYSQNSIPVLRYLETMGEQLGVVTEDGKRSTLLVGTEADSPTCEAIHVVFDEQGAKHTEEDNTNVFKTNQIRSRELSNGELTNLMGGDSGGIYKGYVYPGDGRIPANMNLVLRNIVEKTGNTWKEGVLIKSVYVDKSGVRGIECQEVQSGKMWYQPCSSVVLSLGYTAQYHTELPREWSAFSSRMRSLVSTVKSKVGFKGAVPSTITAAGCSGYFLVKGKMPIIGAQNSHWTEVAYSPEADVTLAKLTGGGNIGSEHIPATYPLNNLEHLRTLFGERLIDVLSIDSCPRAINPQNDVHFYRLLPGLVVSVGLGGTGMTKCGANGALSYLLSHPESSQSQLIPNAPNLFSSIDLGKFVSDYTPFTLRALSLRHDYSFSEVITFASLCLGVRFLVKFFYSRFQLTHHYRAHDASQPFVSRPSITLLPAQTKRCNQHRLMHTRLFQSSQTYNVKSFRCSLRLWHLYKNLRRIRL